MVMGAWAFSYDTLNRLAGASDSPPTSAALTGVSPNYCWTYDAFGNRTTQAGSTAAFTNALGSACATAGTLVNTWATYNANNQITGTPQALGGPTYDPSGAGNILNDGINQYLYDAEGRICAVAATPVPGITTYTGYVYDADGTRIAKGAITAWSCDPSQNGFTTTNDYVLGLGGEQLAEMGVNTVATAACPTVGAPCWQHANVWAGGKLLATYDKDGLHFYFDDPLGTRRAQTDYAGVLEQTCSSLPYGDALNCSGGNLQAPTEHHFTGKERDTESGNYYFEARYYSSSMGRFMSPDWSAQEEPVPYAKLGDPQTLNLYSYVRNNPLINVDPDGHCCEDVLQGAQQFEGEFPVAPVVITVGVLTLGAEAWDHREAIGNALDKVAEAVGNSPLTPEGYPKDVSGLMNLSKDATAPAAKGPVKGADSPTVTSNGQAATPNGEVRGGSGAPRGHSTDHSTKKGAKEAAAQSSKDGKVRNDANPKDGRGGHFHPNETDKKGSEHHYYPKKNNP
jgi:RHS repeat-associated protein